MIDIAVSERSRDGGAAGMPPRERRGSRGGRRLEKAAPAPIITAFGPAAIQGGSGGTRHDERSIGQDHGLGRSPRATAAAPHKETLGFQAEVRQLLHLMIHSLVQQSGDLPARAHLQRLGRRRQAALRGARPPRAVRERYGPRHPRRLRQGRAHHHRQRQRHRHVARRGDHAHRHHRQVRHARVLRVALGRPGEGRAADRPVRRRLLLVVHRRRPRHADDPPRGTAGERGRALGIRRRGRLHDRTLPAAAARHRDRAAPARRPRRPAVAMAARGDRAQVLRPHRAADPDEEGGLGRGEEGLPHRRRGRDRQPGLRAVGAAEAGHHRRSSTRSSTSTSRTTARRRSRTCTRRSRAGPSTRSCSTSRRTRRSTCGTATTGTASSSTCGACSSWTTPSSCCPRTCASSAASSTRTTCRSTSRARSCRSRATSRRSGAAASSACSACSRTSPRTRRTSTRRSGPSSARC